MGKKHAFITKNFQSSFDITQLHWQDNGHRGFGYSRGRWREARARVGTTHHLTRPLTLPGLGSQTTNLSQKNWTEAGRMSDARHSGFGMLVPTSDNMNEYARGMRRPQLGPLHPQRHSLLRKDKQRREHEPMA